MTTLADLKAQAPRTFDKTLIDLMVAIQHGQAPIVTPDPLPAVPRDDSQLQAVMLRMAGELDQANQRIARLEAAILKLIMEATREAA